MAQRLNKNLVVGLTVAAMMVITGAGILLVWNLPGRDPGKAVKQADELVVEAQTTEEQMAQIDLDLHRNPENPGNEEARARRETLRQERDEKYIRAGQYYQKAFARAMSAGDSSSANDYLVRAGELAVLGGDIQMARECWQRVLLNNPRHEGAQQKVVSMLLEQAELYGGQWWREVRREAEKLCEITENANVVGLNALGQALAESPSASYEDMQKAEEHLKTAFDRDPANPSFANSLAMHHLRILEKAIADARQRNDAVKVSELEGQREEAVARADDVYDSLVRALEKDPPEDPQVTATGWRDRGKFHMLVRQARQIELQQKRRGGATRTEIDQLTARIKTHSDTAMECLDKALQARPEDEKTLVLMGQYWQSSVSSAVDPAEQESEASAYQAKAKDLFEEAIQANPDGFEAYLELYSVYFRQAVQAFGRQNRADLDEKVQKATAVLEQRIRRGTPRTGIYQWRNKAYMANIRWQLFQCNAWYAERLGMLAGGIEAADAEVQPLLKRMRGIHQDYAAEALSGEKDPRSLFMKARMEMLQLKQYDAISTFRELQDLLNPGDLWVQTKMYLAELCLQIGEPGPAVEALKAVVEQYPAQEMAWGLLARASAALPDGDVQAEEAARKALALNPKNREALTALGRIYEKQKNWPELERIRKLLAGDRTDTQSKLLEASVLLTRGNDPEQKSPDLIAKGEDLLREILKEEPSHLQALRSLVTMLSRDPSKRDEAVSLLANASEDVDQRLKEAASATQPADQSIKKLKALRANIDLLALLSDPNTDEAERLQKTAEIIRQNDDPFLVAVDLYRLYIAVPQRRPEAVKYLKEAYRLKPDDPTVVEMLFRVSISALKDEEGNELVKPDWKLAEELAKRAVDLKIDRSGGHYYRGQLLFAQQHLKDNFEQAEREFREGLKVFPVHSNGYAWLARSLLAQNRVDEAYAACLQAVDQNPRNGMAALFLARIADLRGDEENKQKYLERCRELAVVDDWVRSQLQILADRADPRKGIARREEIRKKDPKDFENLVLLAQLYEYNREMDKCQEAMAQARALRPQDLAYLQRYVMFLRRLDPPKMDEAEAVIRKVLEELDPQNQKDRATVQLMLAAHMEVQVLRGMPDAPPAEQIDAAFAEAARIAEGDPMVMKDIAAHYRRQGNAAKFEEWIRKSIDRAERDKNVQLEKTGRQQLLEMLLETKDYSRVADIRREIEAYRAKFDDPLGLLALSDYASMLGRETKAIEYVTQYINASSGMRKALGLFRRGSMNYRRGDWDLAISDLREAKTLSPDGYNYEHRILLARCLQVTGQTDQAITELSSILKENRRAIKAAEALFQVYMAGQRFDDAEAFIMPAYQQEPKSTRWIGLLAEVAAARGDENRAIERAVQTVENGQYEPQLLDNLLSNYLRFRRFDDLVRYVSNTLPESSRSDARVLARLALAHAGKGDMEKASETYGQALATAGANAPTILRIILDLPRVLGNEAAGRFADQEAAKRADDLLAQAAGAYIMRVTGDQENFLEKINGILSRMPSNDPESLPLKLDLLQNLAGVHYERKEFAAAQKAYEQLLEIAPENSRVRGLAANNLAYMLMESLNDPAAALRYSEEADRLLPLQSNVLDTLGWNLVLTGKYDRGIAMIRQAIYAASPLNIEQMAAVHYHAAAGLHRRSRQLQQEGQTTEAEQDMAEAKLDCRRAHGLLVAFQTGDELLGKVVELGNQLGLKLEAKPAAAEAASALP